MPSEHKQPAHVRDSSSDSDENTPVSELEAPLNMHDELEVK